MYARNCPLKIAAKESPNSLAIIDRDFSLTYKELDAIADLVPKKNEGEVIATLPHCPCEFIAHLFAYMRMGVSLCPLNLRLPQIDTKRLPSTCTPQSILLFTSGSTGVPKIAILSFQSLLTNAAYSLPLLPTDRWLLSLPLYHVGGIGIVLRCVLAKAAIVLDKNHPGITHLSFVPTQLYRECPIYKNLKCILLGGAPITSIPEDLPITATYGLTEMGSMVLARENPPLIDGHFYLGNPLPKREIRLSPDGEILVRGETLFDGYVDQPREEWFATGDIGRRTTEGIAIIGRKDWQFISGGENIQPEEIELALLQIPDVLEAVVIPKKDPEFGMRPVAVINTRYPIAIDKIKETLQQHLPKFKIPIAFHFIDEIPKKGLKIDRRKLFQIIPFFDS